MKRSVLLGLAALVVASRMDAALLVSLSSSPESPAPVGTIVTWTAHTSAGSDDLWYRFRVGETGGGLHVVRDFGPGATLGWTSLVEGVYDVELTVRDLSTNETSVVVESFRLSGRAATQPVVSSTAHPLVFLFSAPPCAAGAARVRFEPSAGGGPVQFTSPVPCDPARDVNVYLAGLSGNTAYSASLVVEAGRDAEEGPAVTFMTGTPSYAHPLPLVLEAPASSGAEVFLLQSPTLAPAFATDLAGNLVWYGTPSLGMMTRPETGGTFWGIVESRTDPAQDFVRKTDLVGTTLAETNAARVNEQLATLGMRPITGFHHEARAISGGRTLVLGGVERILPNAQPSLGLDDVLGDMMVVLDSEMQVVWAWDAFDHLDVSREAILGEHCKVNPGCPPWYLAPDVNDWTHANSAAETPDGNLLLSVRHQDWVLKIDYAAGSGAGDVLWRLGKEGDFALDVADPTAWFSHQHDVEYEPGLGSTISLFDNGNTRIHANPQGVSRGQVLQIDETAKTAHLAFNAELGYFSLALGSAQHLSDGTWHFDAGFVFDPSSEGAGKGFSLQLAPAGTLTSSYVVLAPVYRSFRVTDLYGPAPSEPTRPGTRVLAPRD